MAVSSKSRPAPAFVTPMAAQPVKALIAGVLPQGKRSQAFGIFYTGYGTGWLIGSIAAGLLYERSRIALVIFAVAVQLVSLPIFTIAHRPVQQRESTGR